LLGVKVVLAESFERIHRSNLVMMGVLPLQFLDGETAESLGLTGHEHYTIDLPEDVKVGQVVTVHANSEKGSKEFQALVRFDAEADIRYYRHGGILPMVGRKNWGKCMTETNGLKDAIACDTRISAIEDDRLSYAGYDIAELMDNNVSFEEVIYLLWNLHLPTQIELNYFEKKLREGSTISDAVEQCILIQSRQHLHPMSVLRSTVSLLGVYNVHAEENSIEALYDQSIQIMAKVPTIIATFDRLRRGLVPIEPRSDLGFAANFLYMLNGEEPSELQVKAFSKALVLY
jgi:hypothetical protein